MGCVLLIDTSNWRWHYYHSHLLIGMLSVEFPSECHVAYLSQILHFHYLYVVQNSLLPASLFIFTIIINIIFPRLTWIDVINAFLAGGKLSSILLQAGIHDVQLLVLFC